MRRSRFSEAQIVGMLKEAELGKTVEEVCRSHGIIRPWSEPAKNWDAECSGRSAEPAFAYEWVVPGRNRVNSGPLWSMDSKAMSPVGSPTGLTGSLLSPHGCLVGRPVH